MPLKFYNDNSSSSSEVIFDTVEYNNTPEYRHYRLADSKTKAEIRVKYIPTFESTRDPNHYECILFENSYLTAENDVFEVYESTLPGRVGWIFPISALDSNENDFAENNSFKHYRHIAYQKLLSHDYSIKLNLSKEEYRISEIFQGISVFILSKEEIAKLEDYKIENYALSFLKTDYLIFKKVFQGKKTFNKNEEIEALRKGNHKLKLKKAAFDITANQYTNSLFIDHLYQTENILTKYILLYQILEQFIQDYGDSLLEDIIKEYQDKKITKNTLREKIGHIQNDRTLLKKTFEKTVIKTSIKQAFLQKCTYLFNDVNLIVDQNFENAIYDFRNLITHNYRLLTGKTDELNELVYLFELIIIELLIGFNEKPDEVAQEEVASSPPVLLNVVPKSFVSAPKTFKQKLIEIWNSFLKGLLIKP